MAKLFEERAEQADHAYQDCTAAYKRGTIALDPLLAAVDELAEAKLALAKGKEERLAIHDKQVERGKDIEAEIRALNDVAARGGEEDKLARAALARVKAEIAMEQEKRDRAPAKADDKLAQLIEQCAKLAEKAYQVCVASYKAANKTWQDGGPGGWDTAALDAMLSATNELAEARLALCTTKSERLVVREQHLDRAKKHESTIKDLSDRQVRGGEADRVARAAVQRKGRDCAGVGKPRRGWGGEVRAAAWWLRCFSRWE